MSWHPRRFRDALRGWQFPHTCPHPCAECAIAMPHLAAGGEGGISSPRFSQLTAKSPSPEAVFHGVAELALRTGVLRKWPQRSERRRDPPEARHGKIAGTPRAHARQRSSRWDRHCGNPWSAIVMAGRRLAIRQPGVETRPFGLRVPLRPRPARPSSGEPFPAMANRFASVARADRMVSRRALCPIHTPRPLAPTTRPSEVRREAPPTLCRRAVHLAVVDDGQTPTPGRCASHVMKSTPGAMAWRNPGTVFSGRRPVQPLHALHVTTPTSVPSAGATRVTSRPARSPANARGAVGSSLRRQASAMSATR